MTVSSHPGQDRIFTIPNFICALRLLLSPALVALAWMSLPGWFLVLYVVLALSDWVDGKLAIRLNQRSAFGARLDSAADVSLYLSLLLGSCVLAWTVIQDEWPWIALAIGSYVTSSAAGLWKFGRFPTYHTRGAKISWLLLLFTAVAVHMAQWVWPLRVSMLAVLLVNLESLLITCVLPESRRDVPSLWHALRLRKVARRPSQ